MGLLITAADQAAQQLMILVVPDNLSLQSPSIPALGCKQCGLLTVMWVCVNLRDLYHDIAIPGGIAMKSFSEAWALFCQCMDYNHYSLLPSPVKQLLTMVSK